MKAQLLAFIMSTVCKGQPCQDEEGGEEQGLEAHLSPRVDARQVEERQHLGSSQVATQLVQNQVNITITSSITSLACMECLGKAVMLSKLLGPNRRSPLTSVCP